MQAPLSARAGMLAARAGLLGLFRASANANHRPVAEADNSMPASRSGESCFFCTLSDSTSGVCAALAPHK
jgi:hypothetical protein